MAAIQLQNIPTATVLKMNDTLFRKNQIEAPRSWETHKTKPTVSTFHTWRKRIHGWNSKHYHSFFNRKNSNTWKGKPNVIKFDTKSREQSASPIHLTSWTRSIVANTAFFSQYFFKGELHFLIINFSSYYKYSPVYYMLDYNEIYI